MFRRELPSLLRRNINQTMADDGGALFCHALNESVAFDAELRDALGVPRSIAGALAAFHYNGAKPAWLALTSLVGYIVFFSLGLGAIPWLIMGEIFPGHVRALAASAATLLNWCLSFIVSESFASLLSALGPANTFTTFAAVCAVGVGFVALCVPETKGKTFEEIEALFR